MTVEDCVEDQKLSLEIKEEQIRQLKETLEARERIEARERQVERTKTVSYLTGTLMDKEQRLWACSRTAGARGYRGDGF